MKKEVVLFWAVLFVVCLGATFVACNVESQESTFVEDERQFWEIQNHFSCDKAFGFAWGTGKWSKGFLSREGGFDWIAISDSEGFITLRMRGLLPRKIVKKFLALNRDFDFFVFGNSTAIRILNNNWVGTHFKPKQALEDELEIISEKISLKMMVIGHDSLR